ncbi:hypothetical protein [Streptomyces longwoodensis]|uniref:hypothetical protein n=1 Tax=Streptomyces longwoodensis TaxID=68231 RepID=UPI0022545730|nr:hypothetical protein [Streptomyces longwoodensis]MCX5000912.1 hypothetical protein [Streptomyces longwoodensis]
MAMVHPTEDERRALCEWLTANNVDINTVPLESTFAIVEEPDGRRLIHYIEFVTTDEGHRQVDPEDPSTAWKRPTSALCLVDPPSWLNIPGTRA